MQTAIDRLKRVAGYAEEKRRAAAAGKFELGAGAGRSELYACIPCRDDEFLTEIDSPALRWSFTANHAHFLPGVGISISLMRWISLTAMKCGSWIITVLMKSISGQAKAR